jgi:hypothetical protein
MRKTLKLVALCCAFVCSANDSTVSWPSDYQEKLSAHISATRPVTVKGMGEADVTSQSYLCLATPGYGKVELTFESVWQSLSVTDGYLGFDLNLPPFRIILR